MNKDFTNEQNEIINFDHQKNLVINACAGSGKTTVLLERSRIICEYNNSHKKHLLLTTNNTVKKEIKENLLIKI